MNFIQKNTVVSLQYKLYDHQGRLIDETEADMPMVYLHGGYDGIFPLVEEALQGKMPGDTVSVTLDADNAFGDIDESLIRVESADIFPVPVEVGMMFEADDPETGDILVFRVIDVADGQVTVDANHPLAGAQVRFDATVAEVRPAKPEEIEHGHPHTGHHHHEHGGCCGGSDDEGHGGCCGGSDDDEEHGGCGCCH